MKKKTAIILCSVAFIISIIGIVIGVQTIKKINSYKKAEVAEAKNKKDKDNKEKIIDDNVPLAITKAKTEISGIDTSEEDEETSGDVKEAYSDLYKKYLELSDEEKEKTDVVPRKYDVPFNKLDDIKKKQEEQKEKEESKNDDNKKNINNNDDNNNKNIDNNNNDNNNNNIDNNNNDNNNKNNENDDKNKLNYDKNGKIPSKFNLADYIDIKVENQSSYGLCWDFASLNTLETYLAINDLGNYDFSELHVDYITSELMYGHRTIHWAGSFSDFKDYINICEGPVLEKDVPYWHTAEIGSTTVNTYLYDYDEKTYESFPLMPSDIIVTETVDFPTLYKDEYSDYTDEEIKEFRDTVKRHIMTNGGLYTSIVSTADINQYIPPTSDEWANHAVTIVGWDDNYSKDNFLSSDGKKPEKDGAYILLNSWGENNNDGGYYYVSYEDKLVEANLSGIVSTSIEDAVKISSIENEAIRNYLINNYHNKFINYNDEDYITKLSLSSINSIDLSDCNLTSIEGLEIFDNLYSIDLSNNNIEDFSPLAKISSLCSINLSNNNITDITFIKDFSNYYSVINLSNNPINDISMLCNIKDGLYSAILSNCNITDISSLKDVSIGILDVSDNPGITGLSELKSIDELVAKNCDLVSLPELTNLTTLDVSNNKITSLDGIENMSELCNLNISTNPVTDWSALNKFEKIQLKDTTAENTPDETLVPDETLAPDDDYWEYDDYSNYWFDLTASNCNIEDISIFSGYKIDTLILSDNNITDVSKLENYNIYYLDLSNNKNLTNLGSLKNIYTLYLNDCGITDVSDIIVLESVRYLSLNNNDITDISIFSNMTNLGYLSLSGNKNLTGTIKSQNLYSLNISNCNIDDNFDFSGMPLGELNISDNPDITDPCRIIKTINTDNICAKIDAVDFQTYEKLMTLENDYCYYSDLIVNVDCDISEHKDYIDLTDYPLIKKQIIKSITNWYDCKCNNCYLSKNCYTAYVNDYTNGFAEIQSYNTAFRFNFN